MPQLSVLQNITHLKVRHRRNWVTFISLVPCVPFSECVLILPSKCMDEQLVASEQTEALTSFSLLTTPLLLRKSL
jgi:hypothetical protein